MHRVYDTSSLEDTIIGTNALSEDDTQLLTQDSADHSRYSRRYRRSPVRMSVNALARFRSDNERTAKETFTEKEAVEWTAAMLTEILTFNQLDCWKEVEHPNGEQVLHTKFLLRRKRNEKGEVEK